MPSHGRRKHIAAERLMNAGIPQRKAISMNEDGSGREVIARKIGKLIREEGKTPSQAAGQAFGMARGGDLGSAAKKAAGRKPKG